MGIETELEWYSDKYTVSKNQEFNITFNDSVSDGFTKWEIYKDNELIISESTEPDYPSMKDINLSVYAPKNIKSVYTGIQATGGNRPNFSERWDQFCEHGGIGSKSHYLDYGWNNPELTDHVQFFSDGMFAPISWATIGFNVVSTSYPSVGYNYYFKSCTFRLLDEPYSKFNVGDRLNVFTGDISRGYGDISFIVKDKENNIYDLEFVYRASGAPTEHITQKTEMVIDLSKVHKVHSIKRSGYDENNVRYAREEIYIDDELKIISDYDVIGRARENGMNLGYYIPWHYENNFAYGNIVLFTKFYCTEDPDITSKTVKTKSYPQTLNEFATATYRIVAYNKNNLPFINQFDVMCLPMIFNIPKYNASTTYEYKSQVVSSYTNTEQRVPLRNAPRMQFSYNFDLTDKERVELFAFLNQVGLSGRFYLPDWNHYIRVATVNNGFNRYDLGHTTDILNETQLLVYQDKDNYELVDVTVEINYANYWVSFTTNREYENCLLLPMYICYLTKEPQETTNGLFDNSFAINCESYRTSYKGFAEWEDKYLGFDVLCNWYSDNLETKQEITQTVFKTDYDIGRVDLFTLNDRTYETYDLRIVCNESDLGKYRNFIKRRFGKVNPFFITTGKAEIKKGSYAKKDHITNKLKIKSTSYDLVTRPYICINLANGQSIYNYVQSIADNVLTLTDDLNCLAKDIVSIDSMLLVRFDSDEVTIKQSRYGMFDISVSCVEIKGELAETLLDYDIGGK